MKRIVFILAMAISATCLGQANEVEEREVQVSGRIIGTYNDTTAITVWSDGELIDYDVITDHHYRVLLGPKPHYTILFKNGNKLKYCHVIMHNMDLEHIIVDVNFGSAASVIIYKHRSNAKQYSHLQYSPRGFVIRQYDKSETE